jgi:hypothetical protein
MFLEPSTLCSIGRALCLHKNDEQSASAGAPCSGASACGSGAERVGGCCCGQGAHQGPGSKGTCARWRGHERHDGSDIATSDRRAHWKTCA